MEKVVAAAAGVELVSSRALGAAAEWLPVEPHPAASTRGATSRSARRRMKRSLNSLGHQIIWRISLPWSHEWPGYPRATRPGYLSPSPFRGGSLLGCLRRGPAWLAEAARDGRPRAPRSSPARTLTVQPAPPRTRQLTPTATVRGNQNSRHLSSEEVSPLLGPRRRRSSGEDDRALRAPARPARVTPLRRSGGGPTDRSAVSARWQGAEPHSAPVRDPTQRTVEVVLELRVR